MKLKTIFKKYVSVVKHCKNFALYLMYSHQFRRYLKLQKIKNKPVSGENEYIEKWRQFNTIVEPYSYRLFSRYMEACPDIVPENIGRSYIEPVLNPESMRAYYEDKAMFPLICGKDAVPETVICRMNGGALLDSDFKPIITDLCTILQSYNRLILKPSVGSSSGRGVMLFVECGGVWKSVDSNVILDKNFLLNYGTDFVLQDAVAQHDGMAIFNESSVNTLRLAIYRSWKDEEPHILASIMRVGRNGQFVDNAHAGGMFVGIDVQSGIVMNRVFDQYGNSQNEWNGLSYDLEYSIPCWEEVKDFACSIARKLIHHRLIAMDITINKEGKPQLIEYNLRGFSYWLFMFTNQKPLGEYTDEIIEFCKRHK